MNPAADFLMILSIARTGITGSSGSGDIFVTFSTQDTSETFDGEIQISTRTSQVLKPVNIIFRIL